MRAVFLDFDTVSRDDVDKTFSHQVGTTHRKLMLESLVIDPAIDFPTVEFLRFPVRY